MVLPLYDEQPTRRTPWVTWILIAANVVIFLCLQPTLFQRGPADGINEGDFSIQDLEEVSEFLYKWALIPCEAAERETVSDGACDVPGSRSADLPEKNWAFAFVSSIFLHGSVSHLVGNMLFLWIFGRSVETRLRAPLYLTAYLVTGVLASLAYVVTNSDVRAPVVGASGAIAGVMGTYIVLYPRSQIMTMLPFPLPQLVYIPAFLLLGLFFIGEFFTPEFTNVAWEAHVGGMVAGAVIALALVRWLPKPQPAITSF